MAFHIKKLKLLFFFNLTFRSGKELTAGCVAVFNVDHKSAKELRQYLANIADQCEATSASALPSVVILDNLHHVASLADVFNGFLTAKYQKWWVQRELVFLFILLCTHRRKTNLKPGCLPVLKTRSKCINASKEAFRHSRHLTPPNPASPVNCSLMVVLWH